MDDVVLFRTPRLRAVPWRPDHAEQAYDAYRRPEMVQHLGNPTPHPSLEHTQAWITRIRAGYEERGVERGFWALELLDGGGVVGATICSPLPGGDGEHEIGWHVFPAHWGNGYATESGDGAAAYGFDVLGLDEVFAIVRPVNEPSLAVARRLGMHHLGRTTKYYDGITAELFRLRRGERP